MSKRILLWLGIVLFAAACFFWMFVFPFRAAVVLRAIPADARYVSRHLSPASRVVPVLESGLLDPLLIFAGIDPATTIPPLLEDEGFHWLRERLGRRYVATAYVEALGPGREPAWIASAWIGGLYTHLARLGFLDASFEGFRVVRPARRERIWTGYFPELPLGFQHLSFGFYEGVAFGCATDSPLGALALGRAMRRHQDTGLEQRLEVATDTVPPEWPDRFLVQDGSRARDLDLLGAVSWEEGEDVRIALVTPRALTGIPAETMGKTLPPVAAALLAIAGETSAIRVATTTDQLVALVRALPLHPMIADAAALLHTHGARENAPAAIWLAGGERGGRLMRLRVPALVVAFAVGADQSDSLTVLGPVLQRLNARYRSAWRVEPYGNRGVYAIQSPPGHLYGRLAAGERAGFVVQQGVAVLHSSAQALDQMVATLTRPPPAAEWPAIDTEVSWLALADLPSLSALVRAGVSSFGLWQMMQGTTRDREQEAQILRFAALLDGYTGARALLRDLEGDQVGILVEIEGKRVPVGRP